MKKIMKTLAAVLCCVMISTVFTSCSKSDDDNPVGTKGAVKYTYKLTVSSGTGADDQQDVLKTVINAPNYDGVTTPKEFLSYFEKFSTTPGMPFTELPGTCTITIDESILPDVDLTKKSSYNVGLYIKLEVTSMDANDGVIDFKAYENDEKLGVKSENLSKIYPKKTTLTFSVDKNGKITL